VVSYKIDKLEGVGPANMEKLAKAGITRTSHLLAKCATPKGRKEVAAATGLKEDQVLKFTNLADLMRVKGVAEEYSELLEAAGVDTVKELKTRKPDNLTAKMAEVNAAKKMVRRAPTLAEVTKWVEHAKTLDPVITY
jgi:predicted flap endonuclease-1-like 5' DNA nuclease